MLLASLLVLNAHAEEKAQSLYQVPLKFTNDTGAQIELSKFKGKFVVMSMAYTSCGSTCPVVVEKLKKIEHGIGERDDIVFVVISFDAESDTPEKLREYKKSKEVYWTFLTGEEEQIRTASLLLGVAYEKNPVSGEINHSNKIVLLDKSGTIAVSLDGLNADITPLIEYVKKT